MPFEQLALLFAAAVCAGIIDAIAGGGGLVSLPALLLTGIPPANAIATNKIQALAIAASSAYRYYRAGEADRSGLFVRGAASITGAAIGAVCLRAVNPSLLSHVAPFILIGVSLFFILSGRRVAVKRAAMMGNAVFSLLICVPIGFYDGFFGPGTGSIYVAAFVFFLGREIRSATADTKILNTAGSTIAAAIFIPSGLIAWPAALAMVLGGTIGGQIGALLALRWGAPLIRRVLVIVSIAVAVKLLLQQYMA